MSAAPIWAAVITGLLGILNYAYTRRQEFRKRFWESQLSLYQEALKAAASIAMSTTLDRIDEARNEFWELYWGRLSMIEHRSVERAMINFGGVLAKYEGSPELFEKEAMKPRNCPTELRSAAYKLAHVMRDSLGKTWQPVNLLDQVEQTIEPSGRNEDG